MILDELNQFLETAGTPLIVVLGATASGKTNLSIELALKANKTIEILNADSRQMYKFMDIGTAKISEEEMKGIPHHLFSIIDPKEEITVALYKDRALEMIADVLDRGHIPMLVGGSMLYISSIIDGLLPLPPVSDELRSAVGIEYDEDGGIALYSELEQHDLETAKSFSRQNKRYLVRAIELLRSTGQAPSSLKLKDDVPYDLFIIGTRMERSALHAKIESRTKKLLSDGWIDEVQSLLDRGYSQNDPGLKSHGYREIVQYLLQVDDSGMSSKTLEDKISAVTRQYARRQETWWRGDERIHWIDTTSKD